MSARSDVEALTLAYLLDDWVPLTAVANFARAAGVEKDRDCLVLALDVVRSLNRAGYALVGSTDGGFQVAEDPEQRCVDAQDLFDRGRAWEYSFWLELTPSGRTVATQLDAAALMKRVYWK